MNIELANQDGKTKTVVAASLPFELFGYTFAAHKFDVNLWGVSELTTGARVCTADTRKDAVKNAQMKLISVGAVKFETVMERTRALINRG